MIWAGMFDLWRPSVTRRTLLLGLVICVMRGAILSRIMIDTLVQFHIRLFRRRRNDGPVVPNRVFSVLYDVSFLYRRNVGFVAT